jgi:predicted secreted hydrolase
MLHLADWFSAHLNSKEDIDLQCLRNSGNSFAQGQMFNSFSRGAALIAVSTAGVRITLSRIVLGPGSLFKGRILIRTTRARARSE